MYASRKKYGGISSNAISYCTAKMNDLLSFLRIPSISALPEHASEVRRAAEFVRDWLHRAGLHNARLIEGDGNPLVFAEWTAAPGKPTLLLYGHYDVQPPDPLDEWTSPPFDPAIRNGNIYARGAADDKGQLFILMEAVARLLRERGSLPVNVKFLIEGEEESGGEHIEKYVSTKPPGLAADAAIICDTAMFAPDLPTITTGLRGIVYGEIHVQGPRTDLHSGDYGGAAPNAIEAAAQIIAALKDRDGHIRIPGLYDRVKKPGEAELAAWKTLPFDPEEYREKEIGSSALAGEPEVPVLERVWARPTLEIHGIRGGFTAEGAKTVIPARAVVKISLRLVPDQRPEEVVRQLEAAIAQAAPRGVSAMFKLLSSAPPSVVDTNSPFIRRAAEAMQKVFRHETVYMRCGGSIPIVDLFQSALGIPSVMMGFGLPDDNIHAPNEKFSIANYSRGIDALIEYFSSF
jgi:acetylornithine deacetylase/succinyl-diaminopimelate desuccinylase-like protein